MNPYLLYALIGAIYGVYKYRTTGPEFLRAQANRYLAVAEKFEEIERSSPLRLSVNSVAAAVAFFAWPLLVVFSIKQRLSYILFGYEPGAL